MIDASGGSAVHSRAGDGRVIDTGVGGGGEFVSAQTRPDKARRALVGKKMSGAGGARNNTFDVQGTERARAARGGNGVGRESEQREKGGGGGGGGGRVGVWRSEFEATMMIGKTRGSAHGADRAGAADKNDGGDAPRLSLGPDTAEIFNLIPPRFRRRPELRAGRASEFWDTARQRQRQRQRQQ